MILRDSATGKESYAENFKIENFMKKEVQDLLKNLGFHPNGEPNDGMQCQYKLYSVNGDTFTDEEIDPDSRYGIINFATAFWGDGPYAEMEVTPPDDMFNALPLDIDRSDIENIKKRMTEDINKILKVLK